MKIPPIAYYLQAHDNDSLFLPKALHNLFCAKCESKRTRNHINRSFIPERKTLDISETLDGFVIASRRCKEVFNRLGVQGVTFHSLPATPNFFLFEVDPIIEFDTARRGTRKEEMCSECGECKTVVGLTPVALKYYTTPIPDGIYRTDVEFGSGHEKGPALILGVPLGDKLRAAGLRGAFFEPVYPHS